MQYYSACESLNTYDQNKWTLHFILWHYLVRKRLILIVNPNWLSINLAQATTADFCSSARLELAPFNSL